MNIPCLHVLAVPDDSVEGFVVFSHECVSPGQHFLSGRQFEKTIVGFDIANKSCRLGCTSASDHMIPRVSKAMPGRQSGSQSVSQSVRQAGALSTHVEDDSARPDVCHSAVVASIIRRKNHLSAEATREG